MPSAVQEVLDILDLEPLEVNLFRGRSPQSRWQRVFGGQVIGQALVAACRTVADVTARPPHSLHAYFLLGGDPKVPIIYKVDRIRDGKVSPPATSRRSSTAAPFLHVGVVPLSEPGLTHQVKMPEFRSRTNCRATRNSRSASIRCCRTGTALLRARAADRIPPREFSRYLGEKSEDGRFNVWIRATGRLPDEPAIHQCVLAYASDMMLLDAALIPHGRSVFSEDIMAASLDHALWFHRPFRADEWLLYAQDSPSLANSRGFSRGLIFASDGTLVASVAQEGLLRQRRHAKA